MTFQPTGASPKSEGAAAHVPRLGEDRNSIRGWYYRGKIGRLIPSPIRHLCHVSYTRRYRSQVLSHIGRRPSSLWLVADKFIRTECDVGLDIIGLDVTLAS